MTHYKMISTKAQWLGIDFVDAVFIIIAFAVINLITSTLLFDLVFCTCLYIAIRVLKATKPERWFINSVRYYFKSPYYQAGSSGEKHAKG
ncbi:MAG: hypothetical protein IPJ69_03665 [Deltaproteobacteria bacterium]|nr:MAG: hypothetical protein IPJ69_03665 [Deltaproteobacteria bacterium]